MVNSKVSSDRSNSWGGNLLWYAFFEDLTRSYQDHLSPDRLDKSHFIATQTMVLLVRVRSCITSKYLLYHFGVEAYCA